MASIGIDVSYLVIISLILGAKSEKFVTIDCTKSKIVAQYGTNTLLECILRPQALYKNTKIIAMSWMFNDESLIFYHDGKFEQEAGFQIAERSWSESNMNVSLLITNTKLSHTGTYTCRVKTSNGYHETEVDVSVKANYSNAEIVLPPQKINNEKDFVLTCKAQGYPKGDIKWVVDDHPWVNNPQVEVALDQTGLYNLTSKLTVNTEFKKFVCKVNNDKGVQEGEREFTNSDPPEAQGTGSKNSTPVAQIVAPVVVIGSLIVGLLLVLLVCRKRQKTNRRLSAAPLMSDQREVPLDELNPEEGKRMV